MKIELTFEGEKVKLRIMPETEAEKLMIGVIAENKIAYIEYGQNPYSGQLLTEWVELKFEKESLDPS